MHLLPKEDANLIRNSPKDELIALQNAIIEIK